MIHFAITIGDEKGSETCHVYFYVPLSTETALM
jgi:hypothetical protein